MEQVRLVYITFSDISEARSIGRALIDERLVACANIYPNVHSIFPWEGQVSEEEEVVMIGKSVQSLIPKIVDFVKEKHSYDCPAIVSLPVEGGNLAFLEWVHSETKETE